MGLTVSISYTCEAYSATGCNTADEIASATSTAGVSGPSAPPWTRTGTTRLHGGAGHGHPSGARNQPCRCFRNRGNRRAAPSLIRPVFECEDDDPKNETMMPASSDEPADWRCGEIAPSRLPRRSRWACGLLALIASWALQLPTATVASAESVPGRTEGVTAAPGDGQATLRWSAAAGATGYQYRWKSGALRYSAWTDVPGGGSRTSHPVTRLANGTEYAFQVRGKNAAGPGTESAAVTATPVAASAPAKPANVAAQGGDAQVTLTWTALAGATGWEVRRRSVGGSASDSWGPWTAITNGGAATARHVVTGLANGVRHAFRVRAKNANGYGPASDVATARPVSATGTVPRAPGNLRATGRDGDVMLQWDLDFTAKGYEYRQKQGSTGAWGEWIPVGFTTAAIVGDLTNGTRYGFQVRAVNRRGEGAASAEATATPATPSGGPAKPVVTAQAGPHSVTLSWAADGNAAGWEYQKKVGAGRWSRWVDTVVASPATATGVTLTGLAPYDTQHAFRVRAYGTVGGRRVAGAASAPVFATPLGPRNAAPTGKPSIRGLAYVGQTLEAFPEGISDDNGMEGDAFTYIYQWIRVDRATERDIAGATAKTYVPVTADRDKRLKVRVSYVDHGGTRESVTSAPTPPVLEVALQGEPAPPDPPAWPTRETARKLTIFYDVAGGTATEPATGPWQPRYDFVGAKAFTAYVMPSDLLGGCASGATLEVGWYRSGALTTRLFGDSFSDADAHWFEFLPPASGGDFLALAYCVQGTLRSTAVNLMGRDGKVTITGLVEVPANVAATGNPRVLGTVQVGKVLSASRGSIADANGLAWAKWDEEFAWQWLRVEGGAATPIAGATGPTYRPVAADQGKTLKVRADFADDLGYAESRTSGPTATVVAQFANRAATGKPSISGTARVGLRLIAGPGDVADDNGVPRVRFGYDHDWRWLRIAGGSETPIAGATGRAYRLVAADTGATIKVRVSFIDGDGHSESRTSDATATVAARPANRPATGAPRISNAVVVRDPPSWESPPVEFAGGLAYVGVRLGSNRGDVGDGNGTGDMSPQWLHVAGAGSSTTMTPIAGAVFPNYTPKASDVGKRLAVRYSFTDGDGYPESRTSLPTAVVRARPRNGHSTGTPTITGTVQVGQTLTAHVNDVTDPNGAGSVYNPHHGVVYRYQWCWRDRQYRGSAWNSGCLSRAETGSTFVVPRHYVGFNGVRYGTHSLVGAEISVRVSFLDNAFYPEVRESAWMAVADRGANQAATGQPEIEGTARVGQTLMAARGTIADGNGLTRAVYAWQWIRVDGGTETAIAGETSATYLVASADLGKTLEVRASFTDDAFYAESRTSDATAAVAARAANQAATGKPEIEGTAQVGQTLMAARGTVADGNGLTRAVYAWQWIRVDGGTETAIAGETSATYLVVSADEGKTLEVRASFTDDASYAESRTSDATATVAARGANQAATGKPEIEGTAQVGQRLTAATGTVADGNGLTRAVYAWQWIRVDGGTETAIAGETNATYVVAATDEGKTLKVRASFTDDAFYAESRTSDATATVAAANQAATGQPEIEGTARVGQTLTAARGTIADGNGLTGAVYAWQWIRVEGGTETDIAGETNATYVVVPADRSKTLKVRASFADDLLFAESRTSAATGTVAAPPANQAATGKPEIEGTAQVGKTLTAARGTIADGNGLTRAVYTWQWIRVDGGTETAIAGETSATYVVASADEGKTLKVRASFTDDAFHAESRTSDATATVAAPPANQAATGRPEIRGTAQVGKALTAARDTVADGNGLTRAVYAWQWIRVDGGTETAIAGETNATYVVAATDEGKTLKVRVSFTDDALYAESRTSDATATVLPAAPPPVAAVTVVHNGSSLTVTWQAPARATHYDVTYTDAASISWARAAWNRAGTSLTITCDIRPEYQNQNCVDGGKSYLVGVRARNAGGESAWRNSAAAAPPALSVADATVVEPASGEADLNFVVTLDRTASGTVTVQYATADGTATAGADYTAANGTLNFAAGETSKTVSVTVLADSHNEGSETMTFTLSNATGAAIADAEATGTITNDGHIPKAWTARFGRTVGTQVLGAVEARMRATPAAGTELTLAGERIGWQADGKDAGAVRAKAEARREAAHLAEWFESGAGGPEAAGLGSRTVTPLELLTGSSFALTSQTAAGDLASFWGRGAVTRFDGREGEMTLDGEVATAMLGADWTWGREPPSGGAGRTSAGLVLSHSAGEGGYAATESSGEVEATLTGLFPWARHGLSDRLEAWGVAGFGQGALEVTPKRPGTDEDGAAMKADLDLWMAAAGLRGTVLDGGEDGLTLTAKTDAMAVRTSSGRGRGADGGTLAPTRATVTRLRLGLEARRPIALGPGSGSGAGSGGATLTPSFEAGVRHDGGDADTGFGLDLGGGIALSAPASGFEVELAGRGLLTHEAGGFRERGFSGSLAWRQRPDSDRGATLSLTQTVGGSASGGADALLSRTTLDGLAANDAGGGDSLAARRLEVTLGYGLAAFGDRFTLTPEAGAGLSDTGRDLSLGLRLTPAGDTGALELILGAARRESANDDTGPVHDIRLGLTARF